MERYILFVYSLREIVADRNREISLFNFVTFKFKIFRFGNHLELVLLLTNCKTILKMIFFFKSKLKREYYLRLNGTRSKMARSIEPKRESEFSIFKHG